MQVGGLISGAVDIAYRDIRTSKADKKKAEMRVKEVESELSDLKKSLKGELEAKERERARAVEAKNRAAGFEAEIQKLRKEIEGRRAEDVVIAEFKESEEHDQGLSNAAAPEIQWCWIIAEKHVKTDPNAFWGSFVEEFVAAKKAIEDGKGEPEPYDGPTPSFIRDAPVNDNPDI